MIEGDGVCCVECKSILFSVYRLVDHIRENPTHHYFKFGNGDLVIFAKLLQEVRE